MSNINIFVVSGNLTRDPDIRFTPAGKPVASYTVAVDHVYYDGEGNKREKTAFVPVTTYGKQAENDGKFLKKGSSVNVQGHITSWYDEDKKKGGHNFEADNVQYIGKPSGAKGAQADAAPAGQAGGESDEFVRQMEAAERAEASAQAGHKAPFLTR